MAEEAKGYECLGGPMDGAVVGAAFLTKAGEHVCGISGDRSEIYMTDRKVLGTSNHQILRELPFSKNIL